MGGSGLESNRGLLACAGCFLSFKSFDWFCGPGQMRSIFFVPVWESNFPQARSQLTIFMLKDLIFCEGAVTLSIKIV